MTLLIPFGVDLVAEALHCSGILAAVAAGVTMSFTDVWHWCAATRLRRTAVWEVIALASNGSICVLPGEQLPPLPHQAPQIVTTAGHASPIWLLLYAATIVGALLALRFTWVWSSLSAGNLLAKRCGTDPREADLPRLLKALTPVPETARQPRQCRQNPCTMNSPPAPLKYLWGYPPDLLTQVEGLLAQGRLGTSVLQRYPDAHGARTDRALYDYVQDYKTRYLRNAEPLSKIVYDSKLHVIAHALGTHTTVSRVQGGKLKAKREIRVSSVFKTAPEAFLKMIVVHELAHLKEREHNKAFYALCAHMAADYHQLEFDVRLWLTALELEPASDPSGQIKGPGQE